MYPSTPFIKAMYALTVFGCLLLGASVVGIVAMMDRGTPMFFPWITLVFSGLLIATAQEEREMALIKYEEQEDEILAAMERHPAGSRIDQNRVAA